jgi:hypothetical protein
MRTKKQDAEIKEPRNQDVKNQRKKFKVTSTKERIQIKKNTKFSE